MTDTNFYAQLMLAGGGVAAVPQDIRDYVFGSKDPDNRWCPFEWDVSKLPKAKALYDFNTERHDQLQYGSCVGNSWAKTLEIMLKQQKTPLEISRAFIYYNSRARHQTTIADTGTSAFLAAAELTIKGAANEVLWPYDGSKINTKPSQAAYDDGALRKIGRYERIGNNTFSMRTLETIQRNFTKDVKVAINLGMPVVICTGLTSEFYNIRGPLNTHIAQYNPTRYVNQNTPNFIGYHAMVVIGYDDDLGGFIVENSWGNSWGDNGLVLLSYASLSATQFDSFVARSFNSVEHAIPDHLYLWDAKLMSRVVTYDFDGVPGQVYRLYQTAFLRRPDWDGLGYHIYYVMHHGVSIQQIAANFLNSPEFQHRMTRSGITDNRSFVKFLYNTALYRQPDQAGWDYHTDLLDRGVLTRAQVMLNFSESPENKSNCMYYYGTDGIRYFEYKPTMTERAVAAVKSWF